MYLVNEMLKFQTYYMQKKTLPVFAEKCGGGGPYNFSAKILLQLILWILHVITASFVWWCFLSYDVAVIQWITPCHKNRMTTRVITLWRECVTSLTTSMSTMRFHIELMFILQAIKSPFQGSYDKNSKSNALSFYMNFVKLAEGSFHKFHMKWRIWLWWVKFTLWTFISRQKAVHATS